jgi:hypothetical protein
MLTMDLVSAIMCAATGQNRRHYMSVIWIDEEEGIWPLAAYSGPLALSKGVTRGRRRASLRRVERECAFLLAGGEVSFGEAVIGWGAESKTESTTSRSCR